MDSHRSSQLRQSQLTTVGSTFWATKLAGIKVGSLDGDGRWATGEIRERFEYDGVAENCERVQTESGVQDIRVQGGAIKVLGVEQGWELTDDMS